MRAIVEWDGVLADVREACWHAYSQAVAAIGLARTDEATFWRLTRKGADAGQLILGAKPRHIEAYQQHFAATVESDETVARIGADDEAVTRIRDAFRTVVVVTAGANVEARKRVASSGDTGAAPGELVRLDQPLADSLRASVAELGPGPQIVVLAATEAMVRAADDVGLLPIGIASGTCGAKRLAARGARATFANIEAFLEARQSGDPQLKALGIEPPPAPKPEQPRPRSDRNADRQARRQARMSRRNSS